MTPANEEAVQVIRSASLSRSETDVLGEAVLTVAKHYAPTYLDSHELGEAFAQRRFRQGRTGTDGGQVRDYVQHLLREAVHVCRHAEGHLYQLHVAEVCGPSCKRTHADPTLTERLPVCPDCFITLPTSGRCGNCA